MLPDKYVLLKKVEFLDMIIELFSHFWLLTHHMNATRLKVTFWRNWVFIDLEIQIKTYILKLWRRVILFYKEIRHLKTIKHKRHFNTKQDSCKTTKLQIQTLLHSHDKLSWWISSRKWNIVLNYHCRCLKFWSDYHQKEAKWNRKTAQV